MLVLTLETGPHRGKSVVLPDDGARTIGIGRDERCAVRLQDRMVSRVHCVLRRLEGGGWELVDRQSRNGTFVNDARVKRHTLAASDVIQVGEFLISVRSGKSDPLVGTTVGGYRIDERIGRGAAGTVYRAVQLSLDRPVALKVLSPRAGLDDVARERFLAEARAAARLNHPNVVEVHDAGRDGDLSFIVMEFLSGGSLGERLVRRGRLRPEEAISVGIDAARALAFAEEHRIVHRDIKPGNLLFTASDHVKLVDLGIALDLRLGGDASSRAAGSPRYMAPEQASGGDVDHRADIYALGSTLYTALAGAPPFEATTFREVIEQKLSRDPEPLWRRVPEVSRALSDVIQKMLSRRREDRHANASELLKELESVRDGKSDKASPGRSSGARAGSRRAVRTVTRARPPSAKARARRSSARRAAGVSGGAVGVLVGVTAIAGIGLVLALLSRGGDSAQDGNTAATNANETSRATSTTATTAPAHAGGDRERRGATTDRQDGDTTGRAVASLLRRHSAGELSEAEALRQLEALLARADDEATRSRVEGAIERLQRLVRLRAEEMASKTSQEVTARLAENDLAAAQSSLASFRDAFPGQEDLIADALTRLEGAIAARVDAAQQDVKSALARGDFAAARQAVEVLESPGASMPVARLTSLTEMITAAEQAHSRRQRALEQARVAALRAVGALDFAGAQESLQGLGPAAAEESEGALATLRHQVTAATSTWRRIEELLAAAASSRRVISLALAPTADVAAVGLLPVDERPRRYRVVAFEDARARLEPASSRDGAPVVCSPLVATSESLLELIDAKEDAGVRHGLGVLFALRRGDPDAAQALLRDESLEPAWRRDAETLLGDLPDLRAGLDEATAAARHSQLRDRAEPADAAAWNGLASEVAEVLVARREGDAARAIGASSAGSGPVDLEAIYLESRQEALAQNPPEEAFHARSIETGPDGRIRLVYDFSDAEQIRDFHASAGRGAAVAWDEARRTLVVQDEARFLRGEPFRDELGVAGIVASVEEEAPNINVALWTNEGDRVTLRPEDIDLRRWRTGSPQVPIGYVVAGMGFYTHLDLGGFGGRGFGRFARGFLPPYLREPTHVLLTAEHGESLHSEPGERLWTETVGKPLRAPARFQLSWQDRKLRWTFNRKKLAELVSPELERVLSRTRTEGSLTLFTNGRTVAFASLEIAGRLSPTWLRERAASRVRTELARLTGRDPEPAPPPAEPQPGEDNVER